MDSFNDLKIDSWLLGNIERLGFSKPTEVQERSIPIILSGSDVSVRAKTGTGKTGAYLIPILQMLHNHSGKVRAIVIVPTRELSLQVYHFGRSLCHGSGLNISVVYGGVSINPQIQELRQGADIVVGTPGRILDLANRGDLKLRDIEFVVLDEADIMLDMGFIDDIKDIISRTDENKRRMLLFSATMPEEIVGIADRYMKNKEKIIVGEEEDIVVNTIRHLYAVSNKSRKFSTLLAYLKRYSPKKTIIFTATQHRTESVFNVLKGMGYSPFIIHGGLTQAKREYQMNSFRKQDKSMLIATNVASRGIDISEISDIINFDAPDEPKVYVHRVGRSARMGKEGRAFTIFEYEQMQMLGLIERFIGMRFEKVELDTKEFSNIDFAKYIGYNRYEHGNERTNRGFGERRERDMHQRSRDSKVPGYIRPGSRPYYHRRNSYNR